MASDKAAGYHSPHGQSFHFQSLVNRQGKVHVHGSRVFQNPFADLYHYFFSLTWPAFFVVVGTIFITMNLLFGALYLWTGVETSSAAGTSVYQRLLQCFFFSIENMTAVDYGRLQGAHSGAYVLMTVQAFIGLLTLAIITGLFYARFSRATARVIFSSKAIIAKHNGRDCLIFRIANERLNQIAEAHMSLHLTKNEISLEGEHTRKFYDLKLERDHSPLFALSWMVRHYIDEESPMHGMDHQKMREDQIGLLASLTGTDETFSQPIIARHAYAPDDIVYNRRFKDIIIWHDRQVHINLKGIHDLHEPEKS